MKRIAIVLGAGGITGIAWMLGAVEAIRATTGWDPGEADVLCGTSAGAVAAAITAAGVPHEPLIRMGEDPDLLDEAIARAVDGRAPVRHGLPVAWPGSLALGLTGLASLDPALRVRSLAGLAPAGFRSGDEIRGLVHAAARLGWPDHPRLLINATDYRTARRVTFGLDGAPAAPLAEAVSASAAVPGWYRPVTIGGRRYVDGGVISFSNADVLAPFAPDLVICLSPFGTRASGGRLDRVAVGPLRRAIAGQLERELAGLRAAGSEIVTFAPGPAEIAVMGVNPMERHHARAVHAEGRRSVSEQLLAAEQLPAPLRPRRAVSVAARLRPRSERLAA